MNAARARGHHLAPLGALYLAPDEGPGQEHLLLPGPLGRAFRPRVTATPEFGDGAPDPPDRWSTRVFGALAHDLGAVALSLVDGPRRWPFTDRARRSGRAWPSPVGLLVHDSAGLMLSYRGALARPCRIALPHRDTRPGNSSADQPCRRACPESGGARRAEAQSAYYTGYLR